MNILFVNHSTVRSNSGIHITNVARHLTTAGCSVAIAVPDEALQTDVGGTKDCEFPIVGFAKSAKFRFPDGQGPDLVHAWTPRQFIAEATRRICERHQCPYVVHLEDNEHVIAAAYSGMSVEELTATSAQEPAFKLPMHVAHPTDMRRLLEGAAGVTVLLDRLMEFKPDNVPGVEFWPAAEDDLFKPTSPDPKLRQRYGIPNSAKIIVYNGNVHPANVNEVRSLYLAVAALARSGVPVVLVRLGTDHVEILPRDLRELDKHVIKVEFQPRAEVARFLALADVLVQPGRIDPFNDYRFPSKLPEFFAMGKPVILPATNVGLAVEPDKEAVLLKKGDAIEIASAVRRIFRDPEFAASLSAGGRRFYERELNWGKSAKKVKDLYSRILQRDHLDRLDDTAGLRGAAQRYIGQIPDQPLSYATVSDFCDSFDNLHALTTINQDLKDVQRPWVLKTILGMVPIGGHVLEIGAGDPWVADLLSRLGYRVTVIDPYDGRDRGPQQFKEFCKRFPGIRFVKGLFPDALQGEGEALFDCIYSISVLEHLPLETVDPVFDGIKTHSRSELSPTIHAIDHVHLGNGAELHLVKLEKMLGRLGFAKDQLGEMLTRMDGDPETYFLSAEAHNRWRGSMSYSEFPMRRCVSIQVSCQAGGSGAASAEPNNEKR